MLGVRRSCLHLLCSNTACGGGGHCNFTEFEVNATVQSMLDWADTGTQPSAADIETACLALPGASAGDCDFDQAFTVPAFTDRVPARPDWPDAAK